tara:strand:+ start:4897 stop:5055 length:159 start_codon:yes stop_codon:yes gene_type:complete
MMLKSPKLKKVLPQRRNLTLRTLITKREVKLSFRTSMTLLLRKIINMMEAMI